MKWAPGTVLGGLRRPKDMTAHRRSQLLKSAIGSSSIKREAKIQDAIAVDFTKRPKVKK
mgnify:CR=1 FL=1